MNFEDYCHSVDALVTLTVSYRNLLKLGIYDVNNPAMQATRMRIDNIFKYMMQKGEHPEVPNVKEGRKKLEGNFRELAENVFHEKELEKNYPRYKCLYGLILALMGLWEDEEARKVLDVQDYTKLDKKNLKKLVSSIDALLSMLRQSGVSEEVKNQLKYVNKKLKQALDVKKKDEGRAVSQNIKSSSKNHYEDSSRKRRERTDYDRDKDKERDRDRDWEYSRKRYNRS